MGKRIDIAVFPLPDAVLFPGTSLPIHLFQARHEKMLEDIRARGWWLALLLALPLGPSRFSLNAICGAGVVQVSREHPDGRMDVCWCTAGRGCDSSISSHASPTP